MCLYNYRSVIFTLVLLVIWVCSAAQIVSHDFNSTADGWTTSDNWIRNTSSFSGNTTNHWHCNPFNNYDNSESEYVTSGTLDLSGYESLTLSISIRYDTEVDFDGLQVQYSADNGSNWSVLGTATTGTNWYNDTDVDAIGGGQDGWSSNNNGSGWQTATHTLPASLENNSTVRIRLLFASDNSVVDDGVAFDDFSITGTVIPPVDKKSQGSGFALDFDGSNDYVSLGTSTILRPASNVSVEAWVYAHSFGAWVAILGNLYDSGSDEAGYGLVSNSSTGNVMFWVQTSGGSTDGYSNYPQTSMPLNTWTHVAGTYDGSNLRLYINGVLVDTDSKSGSIDYSSSPLDARIGQYYDNNESQEYNGLIDELRIWSTARSQTDIRDNMCQKLVGNETGLLAYYRMDNASGTKLSELTANGLSGTLNNMDNTDWVTSGAAIGDASNELYTGSWTGMSVSLASTNNRGTFQINSVTGTPSGIHVYRVDTIPNSTTGISPSLGSSDTYYGTFVVDGTSPTYTAQIDYTGYADAIAEEPNLTLYNRADNSVTSWTDITATVNAGSNTISESSINSRREFILGGSSNPLPVDLVTFSATPNTKERVVDLFWITSSEVNNDYFTVERTKDLKVFEEVTQVVGQGTTNERTEYNEVDFNPLEGVSYYRLSQTDYDGKKEYFNLEKVLFEMDQLDEIQIELYPNPNNGQTMFMKIPNSDSEELKVLVNDFIGKEFFVDFTVIDQGDYSVVAIEMNEKLAAGSYMVNIMVNEVVHTHKLIVQ